MTETVNRSPETKAVTRSPVTWKIASLTNEKETVSVLFPDRSDVVADPVQEAPKQNR